MFIPGIVDEDVDVAVSFEHIRYEFRDALLGEYIQSVRVNAPPRRADFTHEGITTLFLTRGYCEVSTRPRQSAGHGLAKPSAGPRYNGTFPVKIELHHIILSHS